MKKKSILLLLSTALVLSSCESSVEDQATNEVRARSAQVGVAAAYQIAQKVVGITSSTRPSATLGIFTSTFLSQGVFVNVVSAMNGIIAQQKIIQGQNVPTTSETFNLLTELATIMQVDIPDMLNRSTDRASALNEYISSLEASGEVAEQKYHELQIRLEQLQVRRREERDAASAIEREINAALRNDDYGTAASKQEALAAAESTLAQTEVEMNQVQDLSKRFADMLEIADERLEAIVRNREILIAGLRVTEMPGMESLRLLEEGAKTSRKSDRNDIFGTEFIKE